ncbi:unnamed protein product (macronuclear) [Paramecium tetraurelia]|uniref:Uncharacterized protein n=1 Tax=Paramecium tetraurelia TaxID=5888 RepID=A0CYX7_PARTE|nr:uncharacterized protein GSPATT00011595001 [Paramecium tetraurelia]CAK75994.1 unnamed protein product [Paramecium tetraurelia]|eukprot:XP_001443391.1 hypothetical protein (macronuclear) [Paramecium tetraurelia strain d4-2]
MFSKTNQVSPIRTQSPAIAHKHSNPNNSTQAQSYYTSSKTTPIKMQEQKFETIQQGATIPTQPQTSPEKIKILNHDFELQVLKNEITFKEQKIVSLEKALELANEDRTRLRSVLEQKSIICVNKEREIAKLLATIHQLEFKRNENQIIKELQTQIDTLKQFIQENALNRQSIKQEDTTSLKNKLTTTQDQLAQSIRQNESLQQYVSDLMKQNKELSQKYQEKFLEWQQLQMQFNQTSNYQSEIKESEQPDIQKNTLNYNYNSSVKQQSQFDQQNEILKFLSQIKQQYLEESPKRDIDDQEQINVYRPIYSFQSTEDINKTERLNK